MTGFVSDFQRNSLNAVAGVIIFTPVVPDTTSDGHVMSTRPIVVTPAPSGEFSVDLVDVDEMNQGMGYDVSVLRLDPTAGYSFPDFFGRLFPPPGGGRVSDYLQKSTSGPNQWWVDPNPPDPWPNGLVWVNSTTWQVTRKVA